MSWLYFKVVQSGDVVSRMRRGFVGARSRATEALWLRKLPDPSVVSLV